MLDKERLGDKIRYELMKESISFCCQKSDFRKAISFFVLYISLFMIVNRCTILENSLKNLR